MTQISLEEARNRFVEFLKGNKKASATILAYNKDIQQLIDHLLKQGVLKLEEITTTSLEEFKDNLLNNSYTPKSVSRKINSLKTFFRFAKSEGLIDGNPATAVTHPKYQSAAPRILTKLEYRALRDTCREDPRIAAIVELMLQTGIRIGEVANLELDDLRGDSLYIKPFESHAERTVPLNKAASTALKRYLEIRPESKSKAMFITKTGRPLLTRNIRTAIDRYFRLAGIENAKVNDLRHTFIAHQLASGTSPVVMSQLVGHKRLSTTEKYLQLLKGDATGSVKLEEL
jgi:site-specific recombinase XerD